jgi:ElaB/YqjD/DUF883 family membrane-anchored ribosome-binding protein
MAEPIIAPVTGAAPEAPGAVAAAESVAGTAGRAIGTGLVNAAKAVVESVKTDAVTLVGKDVSVGARLEAGLNLAADASSFVVGPEDAAAERAAVFAVKEAAEHAPQIAEAAAAGLHAAAEAAPGIEAGAEKLAVTAGHAVEHGAVEAGSAVQKEAVELGSGAKTVFEHLKSSLEAAGHEIKDSDASQHFIETAKSVWHAVDGEIPDFKNAKNVERLAKELGKDMKTFAPNIETGMQSIMHSAGDVVAKTEAQLAKAMVEKGVVKEIQHGVEKTYDVGKKLLEVGKTAHELLDKMPKPVQVLVGAAGTYAVSKLDVVEHEVKSVAEQTAHVAHGVAQKAEHLVHETGKSLQSIEHTVAQDAKKAIDAVESWHPSMPFEQFGSLLAHIRGGSPAHDPAHDQAHAQALVKSQAQHQGVDR